MKLIFRFLVTLVVMLSAYLFIFWVPLSYVPFHGVRWIPITFSLACALGIGWYVWAKSGSVPEELISSIVNGAVALGLIGFCAGFFWPHNFFARGKPRPFNWNIYYWAFGVCFGGHRWRSSLESKRKKRRMS